jgi:hypothetical protein
MADLGQVPEWLGAAVVGAAIALLGFVGKSIVEARTQARNARLAQRAQLVELHSLLRASGVTFQIQNTHARTLHSMIAKNHPTVPDFGAGFEQRFASVFADLTAPEREFHDLIRSMTTNALRPTNESISSWLSRDVFFKAHRADDARYGRLAQLLGQLEAHLILWHAKYAAWIPNNPEHGVVYLADESKHGLGFPTGIDEEVAHHLGLKPAAPAVS